MIDLLLYCADSDMRFSLDTILTNRRESLNIKHIKYKIIVDQLHDSSIVKKDSNYFSLLKNQTNAQKLLVILDNEWDGSPGKNKIKDRILSNLQLSIWQKGDYEVIVIDPELEIWVWSNYQSFANSINRGINIVENTARRLGWDGVNKPKNPKFVYEELLRSLDISKSSSVFTDIAQFISLNRCSDESFQLFKNTLKSWFPITEK